MTIYTPPGAGFPPTILTGVTTNAGNLGAAYTVNFTSAANTVEYVTGTLNANCTITFSNRAAGCQAYLFLSQDGTGGRTLSVSDGTSSSVVSVPSAANAFFVVEVFCPDVTNVDVVPVLNGPLTGIDGGTTPLIGPRIQLRRGTAAAWTAANPVLLAGEPGYETDTGREKRGDGTTAWTSLAYTDPRTLLNSAPYTVYLSQFGSDSNDGQSPGRPVQTVKKAISLIQSGAHGGEVRIVTGAAAGNFDVAAPISIVWPIYIRALTPQSSTIRRTFATPNSRSVWDAVTTVSGTSVSSATAAFTNADNARIVSIYGAGTNGGTYYDFISGNPPSGTVANLTATTTIARNSTTDPKGVKMSVVGDWNRVVTDASITAPGVGANSVITSLNAVFTAADIGTEVVIANCGTGGQALRAGIKSVSGNTATITATATTAPSSLRCAIGVNFGDLLTFRASQSGLEHLILSDQTTGNNSIGAAVKIVADDGGTGSVLSYNDLVFDNIEFSSTDVNGAWEHTIDADGSWSQTAGGPGSRRVTWIAPKVFGARRSTENIRLNSIVHWTMLGNPSLVGGPITAPIAQGMVILDPLNTAISQASVVDNHFLGMEGQYVYCEGQRIQYQGQIQANFVVAGRVGLELGPTSANCTFIVFDNTTGTPAAPIDNGTNNTIITNLNRRKLTRQAVLVSARGLLAETYDLASGRDFPTSTATTGTTWFALIGLLAGDSVNGLVCLCQTSAGSGLTLVKMGLFSPTGTLLRATASFHASLTTSFGDVALISPYKVPSDGGYYIGFLAVGTTGPSLVRSGSNAAVEGASLNSGTALTNASGAGQTDIGTVALSGNAGTGFWLAAR